MNQILVTLKNSKRGHANLSPTGIMTVFLPTLTELLKIPREYFLFNTTEELLIELTTHELLHEVTGIREDHIIDSWHMLLCRSDSDRNNCDCPITCFFRDCLSKG
ncbi:hypothetical protein ES702_00378 [subsurface metagenome]